MALYRFLFAPVLLAIAALTAPVPSRAPPPPSEQHAPAAETSAPRVLPAALERAGAPPRAGAR